MTRLRIAIACVGLSFCGTTASAQSYPYQQQSSAGYGYGQPASGNPSAGAPYDASQAMYYQQAMQQQMPPPGRMPKLPRGVSAENGLLYYDGRPYADVNYQQTGPNPYQQAAYHQAMQSGMGPEPMSCTATAGGDPGYGYGGYGAGPYGGQMDGNGPMGDGYGGPYGGHGDCNDGDGYGHQGLLWGLFHHNYNPFPGKMGYVWSGGFDVLGMNRDNGTNVVLVRNTNTLATEFNSSQLHFDDEIGGKVWFQLMGPSGIAVQATYMKLATFVADGSVFGADDLQIPFPLASSTTDFFGAAQMSSHWTSAIQSGELNVIYPWGNFQLIGGYRYFEIDERFTLEAINNVTFGTSDFDAFAFNQMHGGQIGVQGQWSLFDLVNFDFWAKFGVFADVAGEHQILRDLNNTVVLRDSRGSSTEASYISEVGAQIMIPLGASLSVHAGYDVFFINHVALAPEQFDFGDQLNSGTHVRHTGDFILHGVNVGLTAVW